MPTEIVQDGFTVIIYTRDEHEPPHVHVFKAEGEAIINLGDEDTLSEIDKVYDMSLKDARKALGIVEDNLEHLQTRWNEIWRQRHGQTENE